MANTVFAHLTDLHIANPAVEEPHYYSDTSDTLAKVLTVLRAMTPRPSFVIVSGDIANNADPAAYAELKRVWGDYDVPTLFSLGNHDNRAAFREVMLGTTENAQAPYYYDRVIDGVHVIVHLGARLYLLDAGALLQCRPFQAGWPRPSQATPHLGGRQTGGARYPGQDRRSGL